MMARNLPILDKIIFQLENKSWYKLTLYHTIIKLEDHLPCNGGIVSSNEIDTLKLNDFTDIKIIPSQEKRHSGAGEIQNLDETSIELLKTEPICFIKNESEVAESFYFNYNPDITSEQLQEIVNDREFWIKRKSYEKKKVIGLIYGWD